MSIFKDLEFGSNARDRMQSGLDTLANAVKVTLGPKGRHAAIEREYGHPVITKDGVTVARSINLSNRVENMGAQLIRHVASATNSSAGDGTTTATVLSQEIYSQGSKMVAAGHNPVLIKKGIDKAVSVVVDRLKELSIDISNPKTIEHVAFISANNDAELGSLISEAVSAIGNDGLISVEESTGIETSVEYTEGFEIDRGFLSPGFVNNLDKMTVELESAFVLVCDSKISMTNDILDLLRAVSETGNSLLIVAKDVQDEALATLLLNKTRGSLTSCAIKAPGFGDVSKDMLEDIAIMCGTTMFSESRNGRSLSSLTVDDLGFARRVVSTISSTTIIDGSGDKDSVDLRSSSIKSMIASSSETYHLKILKNRLSRLTGGAALLRVGGVSDSEVREKKDRVDDAINAVKAAISEGVVPGGGSALLHCVSALEDHVRSNSLTSEELVGFNIITKSVQAPFKQILRNGGVEFYEPLNKVISSGNFSGYDALNNLFVDDMLEAGIVDPTKVVRVALENAASACGTILTTEVAIYSSDEDSLRNRGS
tara:strand:+ start:19928 stop:21550 length:1623 start_codon:yes stop_codon:yes gene_type:complete